MAVKKARSTAGSHFLSIVSQLLTSCLVPAHSTNTRCFSANKVHKVELLPPSSTYRDRIEVRKSLAMRSVKRKTLTEVTKSETVHLQVEGPFL